MTFDPIAWLRCPLDHLALARQGNSVTCARGHCFDLAKGGYLNLLLPQQKSSKNPGDGAQMVASRQIFLNAGYYDPIAAAITRNLLPKINRSDRTQPLLIMDVACGEGFYLSQLRSHLQRAQPSASQPILCFGVDISKFAIKAANRRDREITWVVGSSTDLPVADGVLDVMLCTFFKPDFAVLGPKLKPDGQLLLVVPNAEHLIELRQLIYETVQHKTIDYAKAAAGMMDLVSQENLSFQFELTDPEMLQHLFTMTPHYWRTNPEGRSRLAAQTQLTLTADLSILTFALSSG